MAVRFKNLIMRAPQLQDAQAIATLFVACGRAETTACTLQDLFSNWQRADFTLESDAWAIFTPDNRCVGYADVCLQQDSLYELCLTIHPDHWGRGIEHLLLLLAENRARRPRARPAMPARRVPQHSILRCSFQPSNHLLRDFLALQGYTLTQTCWRIEIDPLTPTFAQPIADKHTLNLVMHSSTPSTTIATFTETGDTYTAIQYDLYEKQLIRM